MESPNTVMLERIKKLMALSQSSNPNEAAIALRRAQKLMEEHQISLDDISLSEIQEQTEEILPPLRDRVLFTYLAAIIGRSFGLDYFFTKKGSSYKTVSFIGPKSRLETACYTFTILARHAVEVKKQYAKQAKAQSLARIEAYVANASPMTVVDECASYGYDFQAYIRSRVNTESRRNTKAYIQGWLRSVHEKVIDFAQDDEESRLIESYIRQHHPNLGTIRGRKSYFTQDQLNAFTQGRKDGKDGFDLYHGVKGAPGSEKLGYSG